MGELTEHLPAIITAAAQSYLGILALLSVALSVLAYFFFAKASEKVKIGIFVLLFLGVLGFGIAMFRATEKSAGAAQSEPVNNPITALSNEARILLKEAALDPAGVVIFERYGGGVDLQTNGKSLIADQSRRAVAVWESALQELLNYHLLIARGEREEVFEITKEGYDVAEHLPI